MFVVAITHLATPPDEEAVALAPLLGKTAYEVRLVLHAGTPALVSTSPDREASIALLGALRARGHGVVACDDDAVLARAQMRSIAQFAFEADTLVSGGEGAPDRLPYDDVLCLLRGVHRQSSATKRQVTDKTFSAGRAILTGGVATRRSTTRDVVETSEVREEVLYLFRRSGAPPWILVDAEAKYLGLGDRLARTQRENFLVTVECLRAMCPEARYDERLLTNKRIPERFARTSTSTSTETSSGAGIDLFAHLLALAIARGQAG